MVNKKKFALPKQSKKANFDIVAMASSAGGLRALSEVLSKLPENLHMDERE